MKLATAIADATGRTEEILAAVKKLHRVASEFTELARRDPNLAADLLIRAAEMLEMELPPK